MPVWATGVGGGDGAVSGGGEGGGAGGAMVVSGGATLVSGGGDAGGPLPGGGLSVSTGGTEPSELSDDPPSHAPLAIANPAHAARLSRIALRSALMSTTAQAPGIRRSNECNVLHGARGVNGGSRDVASG